MLKFSMTLNASAFASILLLLVFLRAAAAADEAAMRQQMEAVLTKAYPADQPGAAVIATRDGEVLYRAARGMANLELGVPLEADMVFRLGSISKQFTGAAIALLEERGELSIDDPITKFLPDYPTHGHEITVAHLLAHTSGIRSYTGILGWMETKIKEDLTTEELVDGFKNEPMDFAPGERWSYSNSGYVLLGAIIEKVTGKSYEDFVEQEIFAPLGMTSSYYGSHDQIILRRASGYDGSPGEYRNAQYLSMTQPHAAGSLLSTVNDLAKWDHALYSNCLLSDETRKKMMTPFKLNDGSSTEYGYGFLIGELRDRPLVFHGGGIFGFITYGLRLPQERIYVAVLTNSTGHPVRADDVARRLAAIAIGDPFPEFEAIELDQPTLESYTGIYRVDEENTRSVMLIDGQLHTQHNAGRRLPIIPHSENGFFYETGFTHLEFVKDEAGGASQMFVYPDGSKQPERADLTDLPLPEIAVVDLDEEMLKRYVGSYRFEPFGLKFVVSLEDGALFAQTAGRSKLELSATSEFEFVAEAMGFQPRFIFEPRPGCASTTVVLQQAGHAFKGVRVE
jgi:CubicO group peptidase (beta-lactamase class C family)